MSKDKLRGLHTFAEVHDYLIRTGQIPNDELYIDWDEALEIAKKVLMPKLNLKEKTIIMTSTPNSKKGFFWKVYNESNAEHSQEAVKHG